MKVQAVGSSPDLFHFHSDKMNIDILRDWTINVEAEYRNEYGTL